MASEEPPPSEPLPEELLSMIDLEPYDHIVTHGREAEYGHKHHLSVHHYIHTRYPHKVIFSTCPPGKSDWDVEVLLSFEMLKRKMIALQCYNHVLPYEGKLMTKAEALIKRYCHDAGWKLDVERYRISKPVPAH